MAERCDKDCREIEEVNKKYEGIHKTLYGDDGTKGVVGCTKILERRKVSWVQLGVTVAVFFTIFGGLHLTNVFSQSGKQKEVQAKCDENAKTIQTYSIKQAVIEEKVDDINRALEKIETKREKDVQILHRRITEFDDKLDKILKEVSK